MPYERSVDAGRPGCLVLLLDRSYSMLEPVMGGSDRSKAQAVAEVVNGGLRRITGNGVGPPTPCHVAVIGYGHEVGPCLAGALGDRELVDASELAEAAQGIPAWVEAAASGATPMRAALEQARATLAAWVGSYPESFPPVIVNITDGAATDGDPAEVALALRGLATEDGNTLLFNAKVSTVAANPIIFTARVADLPDDGARDLFHLSSVVPLRMHPAAHRLGHSLDPGARGVVINADARALTTLLEIAMCPLVADPEPVA